MNMENCIFCKIVAGEIPCAKVWEDEDFMAMLDAFPNTKGMTLVLTKKHYDSYIFDMPSGVYEKFFGAAKKVVPMLEKALGVKRVALVMEGMGVNHAHIKLYPLHGIDEKLKEIWASEKKFYDKYEGYISTHTGEKADFEELKELAEKIKNSL